MRDPRQAGWNRPENSSACHSRPLRARCRNAGEAVRRECTLRAERARTEPRDRVGLGGQGWGSPMPRGSLGEPGTAGGGARLPRRSGDLPLWQRPQWAKKDSAGSAHFRDHVRLLANPGRARRVLGNVQAGRRLCAREGAAGRREPARPTCPLVNRASPGGCSELSRVAEFGSHSLTNGLQSTEGG